MTFKEIYSRIIEHWGETVDFSDGVFFDTQPLLNRKPGFCSKRFNQQWQKIEKEVGYEDIYGELMVWTLYLVFHGHAEKLFRRNIFSLDPRHVSKQEIEELYFANLNDKELAGYERTI